MKLILKIERIILLFHSYLVETFPKVYGKLYSWAYIWRINKTLKWRRGENMGDIIKYHITLNITIYIFIGALIIDLINKRLNLVYYAFVIDFFYQIMNKYASFLAKESLLSGWIREMKNRKRKGK